jgi:hypothetical protein
MKQSAPRKTTKPIVFFSHSSKDSLPVNRMAEIYRRKTMGTVQAFVSSDGQSIQLGHEWQRTIVDALASAKLMFVLVTPRSLDSKWVYFESGYALARGIRVIPVAWLGTRLRDLPSPLSLLQGFEIESAQSMNRLIEETNSEFELNLESDFGEADLGSILSAHPASAEPVAVKGNTRGPDSFAQLAPPVRLSGVDDVDVSDLAPANKAPLRPAPSNHSWIADVPHGTPVRRVAAMGSKDESMYLPLFHGIERSRRLDHTQLKQIKGILDELAIEQCRTVPDQVKILYLRGSLVRFLDVAPELATILK